MERFENKSLKRANTRWRSASPTPRRCNTNPSIEYFPITITLHGVSLSGDTIVDKIRLHFGQFGHVTSVNRCDENVAYVTLNMPDYLFKGGKPFEQGEGIQIEGCKIAIMY